MESQLTHEGLKVKAQAEKWWAVVAISEHCAEILYVFRNRATAERKSLSFNRDIRKLKVVPCLVSFNEEHIAGPPPGSPIAG